MASPQNVNAQLNPETGIITLAIDSSKRLGLSSSGKTIMVGSSHGAMPLHTPDGTTIYVSVNAYVYPPKEKK